MPQWRNRPRLAPHHEFALQVVDQLGTDASFADVEAWCRHVGVDDPAWLWPRMRAFSSGARG